MVREIALTTFYPCRRLNRAPHTTFAMRLCKTSLKASHLQETIPWLGSRLGTGLGQLELTLDENVFRSRGHLLLLKPERTPLAVANFRSATLTKPCYVPLPLKRGQTLLSTAPSGTRPNWRYFHNATKSFRARATMPIRLIRAPPEPNRLANHWLSLLCGW